MARLFLRLLVALGRLATGGLSTNPVNLRKTTEHCLGTTDASRFTATTKGASGAVAGRRLIAIRRFATLGLEELL